MNEVNESGSDAIAGPSSACFVDTDSSNDTMFVIPTTNKVTRKRQKFLQIWLKDPAFKSWLEQVHGDPYKGKCKICYKHITAQKSNLQHHATSQEHILNMRYAEEPLESSDEATCTDVETDSSSDSISISPTAKKRKRMPTFQRAWLEDPAFKPWLEQVHDDPYMSKCKICCKQFISKKSNLLYHANEMHLKNMKYTKRFVTCTGEATRNLNDEIKVAEVKVCIDAVQTNISFRAYAHHIKFAQEVLYNPDVVKSMSTSPRKMVAISKNVINKTIISKTVETVHDKFFSILIDETTYVANIKILCFLIRYVYKDQLCTDLLDLIRVNECTAENLYKCFQHSVKKYNLPISNLVGVCVDNANVMVGIHNSLTSRLIADNSEICIIPCICHSIHLVARHACKKLPKYVEKFLHSLYAYFSQSPKRQHILEDTQQFAKVAKQKVLQPSATRWLALSACINRVLNQWTVLFSVLAKAAKEKDDVAVKLFSTFNCLYTKAYLQFMDYILSIFTELNKLFQSSNVLIHRLLPECYRLLKKLASNFVQSKYLKEPNIHKINVNNVDNLLPPANIFTGSECMDTLSEIEENEEMTEFYTNIQQCYQTAFRNIVKRVPFDDTSLNGLDFLNPQIALDIDKHQHGQLKSILKKFKSKFNSALVINEWHLLPFTFSEEAKEKLQVLSLPQFWYEMSIVTNAEDECILPNISKLAQLCLSLPHSNADVERYFSTVTQLKTKNRNRLNTETLAALTRIKLDLKNKNVHSYEYEVIDDMLNLFNDTMYNKEKIPEELIGILLPDETSDSDSDNN